MNFSVSKNTIPRYHQGVKLSVLLFASSIQSIASKFLKKMYIFAIVLLCEIYGKYL